MIGRITGVLIDKKPPQVLLDVQGVGYEIDVPMSTFYLLPATGAPVTLHTHLIVREDAHLLFGFASEHERRVFRQLLKVNGVGARMALAVLSGLSVVELQQAVAAQESGRLVKIPGIGKKTAERLLLELRDKLEVAAANVGGTSAAPAASSDVINALLALGYNEREVSWATRQMDAALPVGDGIRQALKLLSKG
ncbi:MAG: Holliday junction branch migration protein RuvA [Burkholderiales bacterium]|nr:Holliday junction branch migration protein RuvA [Burkholderiales bacterium]